MRTSVRFSMSCFVSVHLFFSIAFVKIMKGNKNVLYQSYWGVGGFGVLFKQAINPEERVTHSLRHSAAWQARLVHMEPSLGGMTASPSHSFVLIFLFLSPVSWTPGCLIQQQRGRSSRARRRGLGVEHEVQEGYTGVRLPLSGTRSPSASFSHTSPRLLTGGFFHDKRGAVE